jgi:valyl-tRNA synthetase
MAELPSRYDHDETERRWMERWDQWGIHRWDPARPREETFVVDTPPPTVSGSLHVGHVFSYTHQDVLVRFQRMRGRNIAFPMGWDDNGLPTERRVQNVFGIRPNPQLPYDPSWSPRRDRDPKAPDEEVSRLNFIEACGIVCKEDEAAFQTLWRRLGLSVDWSLQYATIDEHCRRLSQRSFLDLYERGFVRHELAPTMWDVDYRTAIAQAEIEDRERPGAYHDVRFAVEGGGELTISTTRPELLAACIAVAAHPDDARYRSLFGKRAITPLFLAPVPIVPSTHADPEKGTGILMVCTFGDLADVDFWRSSALPVKPLVGMDGRLREVRFGAAPFESLDPKRATLAYAEIQGRPAAQARRQIAQMLAEDGSAVGGQGPALTGDPRAITHPVKFYERGERPLEIVLTRQWFVRILEHKSALVEQGRKLQWHPEYMRSRYENWVEGLNQDWCISRQRYSGVPFPVWYPIRNDGEVDFDHPILAPTDRLPIDPLVDCPDGFDESQRDQPGGFTGDPDVMDTWATSSLTPQILSHWSLDEARHRSLFPADIRPQSHEIIRTWAFYTIVKAWMHEGSIPWHHVVISGWILDPDRKKMSKSKGNVITPGALLEEHSADAVRYWAARARLGTDTAFDPKVFKIGKRLTTKLFNASRFVHGQLDAANAMESSHPASAITSPLDVDFVARLQEVVRRATESFEAFEYAAALQTTEEAFWDFCDHYLELVKGRSYGSDDDIERRSAIATLRIALRTFLRLFAPFLPYVSEEVWSWRFAEDGGDRSIHLAAWPDVSETVAVGTNEALGAYAVAVEVSERVRAAKTRAQRSLRWPVTTLDVKGSPDDLAILRRVLGDVATACAAPIDACRLTLGSPASGERFCVTVELGDAPESREDMVR